jgi:hypothetical protein
VVPGGGAGKPKALPSIPHGQEERLRRQLIVYNFWALAGFTWAAFGFLAWLRRKTGRLRPRLVYVMISVALCYLGYAVYITYDFHRTFGPVVPQTIRTLVGLCSILDGGRSRKHKEKPAGELLCRPFLPASVES